MGVGCRCGALCTLQRLKRKSLASFTPGQRKANLRAGVAAGRSRKIFTTPKLEKVMSLARVEG